MLLLISVYLLLVVEVCYFLIIYSDIWEKMSKTYLKRPFRIFTKFENFNLLSYLEYQV